MQSNSNNEEDDDGQLTSSAELQGIFNQVFPQQEEIVYAFGYGSGVFVQQEQQQEKDECDDGDADTVGQQETETKMLDMILVVRDSLQFHTINQQINPHHYAPLFRHRPSWSTWWQRHNMNIPLFGNVLYNPKVFFNFVETPFIKYGVMDVHDLTLDLKGWDSLYIAGRMHKPTATVLDNTTATTSSCASTDILRLQQQHNLPAAVSMALLLAACCNNNKQHNENMTSQTTMSLAELYSQISALSYTGDFRMQVGAEDPGKVNKLVHSPGQLGRFHQMYYKPALVPLMECGLLSMSSATIHWNPSEAAAVKHLWEQLPQRFQHLPYYNHHIRNITNNNHNSISKWILNGAAQSELQTELHQIVAPAARYQSFKGLWTAGLSKSARYALAKLSKGILRKQ